MNWHWLAIAGAVPSALMAILMLSFPETPRWLIKNGRAREACEVLAFLRKTSYEECEDECKEIQSTLGKSYLAMHSGGFLGSAPLLVLVNRGTKSQQGYKRPTGGGGGGGVQKIIKRLTNVC